MFLLSLAVAYLSSVVMLSSVPALIGMSSSPGVFPVLISGPFFPVVSKLRQGDLSVLQAYSIKSDSQWATWLGSCSLARMVNDRLVVLLAQVSLVLAVPLFELLYLV